VFGDPITPLQVVGLLLLSGGVLALQAAPRPVAP
jgi:multidrug transporter EmrE-like cation transporter